MAKLHVINKYAVDNSLQELPYKLKLEAATATVGIINFNSFPGRSGEWAKLKRTHVKEQLDKHADHVLCSEHKTASTYGGLAKFVSPGSWEAFRLYLGLPGKRTDLFLKPPSTTISTVSISSLLKRFGMMHFGLQDPQNSNLIRKMYHTVLLRMSREKDAMQLMQKVDAHSAHVARKVYAITSPSDNARLAHLLFIEINSDYVAFPTLDEIEQFGIDIDFVLNCGDAVDSKWAPSADADPEDDEAQYQLVVCSPTDPLPCTSLAFIP